MEYPGSPPLPQHPRIPEAWLSYLGDRAADPSKDGGLHRATLPPSPARVNLHSPLWVQPCLALPTPLGHSAQLPSPQTQSLRTSCTVCPYPPCGSPAPVMGTRQALG